MADPAVVVQLDAERADHSTAWVDLPLCRRMEDYVRACGETPTATLFITGVGLGKTSLLERCVRARLIDVLVTGHPMNCTLERGTRALYDALGGRGAPRTASGLSLMMAIEQGLAFLGTPQDRVPVIALDEAQHFTVKFLDVLRYLYDRGLCSIVIAGNPRFNLDRDGIDAFLRRVQRGFFLYAETAAQEDIEVFLDARRIAAPRARALLADAARAGGFAGIDDTISRARQLGGKTVPSLADLETALHTMPFLIAPPAAPTPARRRTR